MVLPKLACLAACLGRDLAALNIEAMLITPEALGLINEFKGAWRALGSSRDGKG